MANDMVEKRPWRAQRKASFSDTFSKFTRRQTISTSSSANLQEKTIAIQQHPVPRLPTPSRIPRSTSFFNSFNVFIPRVATITEATNSTADENNIISSELSFPTLVSKRVKYPRTFSDRISHPPTFFSSNGSQQNLTEPLLIQKSARRQHKSEITHRGLMQPLNPPLPRAVTMTNLAQKPTTSQTPGFMRSTSNSTARGMAAPGLGPSRYETRAPVRSQFVSNQSDNEPSESKNFSLPSGPARISLASRLSKEKMETKTRSAAAAPAAESPNRGLIGKLQPPASPSDLSPEEICANLTPETLDSIGSNLSYEEDPEEGEEEPTRETRLLNETPFLVTSNPRQIRTAQSDSYWLGRITSLSDRFRTEALLHPPAHTISNATAMHDDARRIRRVFIHLHTLCTTQEAADSLEDFERAWFVRERAAAAADAGNGSSTGGGGRGGKKVKEKRGVFEMLMGKRR